MKYIGKVFENAGNMKQKIPKSVLTFALILEDLHHEIPVDANFNSSYHLYTRINQCSCWF